MANGQAREIATAFAFVGTSRFEVLAQIGEGATGSVYEVLDRERGARLALKTLRTLGADAILLLKNEFRAVQDLSHPNLVTLHELFEEKGQWFFTMEHVRGESLLAYVRPRAVLDEARLRRALAQLVLGLSCLHDAKKVHRDIKPSNVLVTPEGRVVILDFGIASDLARRDADEGGMVGTVSYMAPEQAMGEAAGTPADWYAVGVVLYEALTGRLPFEGTWSDVLARKVAADGPSPDAIAPDLPRDLCALCVALLRADSAKRPDGKEILARLGVGGDEETAPPTRARSFVGRREELRLIEGAFAEVISGKTLTVLVEGESGVGKSFLVRELTDAAIARDDALVLRGRCYERESVPYKAVDSAIDDLSHFLGSLPHDHAAQLLPEHAGVLLRLFPVLRGVVALAERQSASIDVQNPQEIRARGFAILRELLANVARERKLIMAIDDLQWADADSLALLSEVLRPPDAPPLLLLATLRSQSVTTRKGSALFDAIARLPGTVRHIRLEVLPEEDARELLGQLLDEAPDTPNPAALESILAEAKGHPLFLDELARHRRSHRENVAPTRLDDALWDRASQLAPAEQRLLQLVAVAGVPMEQGTIAHAAALGFGDAFAMVSTLRAGHFVRTSRVLGTDTVEPYHDRVRESVLGRLDAEQTKVLHARLAAALERSQERDPERLLTHWRGAGYDARAAEYAVRAADQAASALAFDRAASLYRVALDLGAPDTEAASSHRTRLAEALANAGRIADAAHAYIDAARGTTPAVALDLRRRAAEHFMCSGHLSEGEATIDAVLAEIGVRAPKTPLGALLSLLFFTVALALRGLEFVPRTAAEVDPLVLLRIDCLYSAGCGLAMQDHIRGKDFYIRTLLASLRAGETSRVARALAFYAAAHSSAGVRAYDKTMQLQAVVAKLAAELRTPYAEALASGVAGYAYLFTGKFRRARDAFLRSEEIFRSQCVGVTYELNTTQFLIGRALGYLGDVGELARRAEASVRHASQRGDVYTMINVRSSATSFLALLRGDADAAHREAELAAEQLSPRGFFLQHAYCLLAQCNVALYRGDAAKVEANLAARWPAIRRSMLLHVQTVRVFLTEVRARACTMLARSTGDPRVLRAAERHLRALEREDATWAKPHALLVRAGISSVRGRSKDALALAVAAEAAFESLEMPFLAAIARRRRGLLVGGDEGRALCESAERWMEARGISDPARLTALYSPGFEREDG